MFIIASVLPHFGWPMVRTKVPYDGDEFYLEPNSENSGASIRIVCPMNTELHAGEVRIRRFLSALSWVEGRGVEVLNVSGGSDGRIRIGSSSNRNITKSADFRVDYLPNPNDERAKLALALYREGLTVNSIPYKFLSFYKIINIPYAKSGQQKKWINSQISSLNKNYKEINDSLSSITDSDIGDHIYVSGRCAIAHAYGKTVIDPDEPNHTKRLEKELPLIKILAERLIENEFKVKSYSTFRREHLYELAGFASRMAPDVVEELRQGHDPMSRPCVPIGILSIRLRQCLQESVFADMIVREETVDKGRVFLSCTTKDSLGKAMIVLDFVKWRLIFYPEKQAFVYDDQSPIAASYEAERLEFVKNHLCNGEVEVYDGSKNLLGRSGPCIPSNIDVKGSCDLIEQKIDHWYKLSESRTNASVNDHEDLNKPKDCGKTGEDLETKAE